MENQHHETLLISSASAGENKRIRLSALLGHMQDAASNHASRLGIGYEQLVPLHRTFMLSGMEIQVAEELPIWGTHIELRTWARKLDRLLAYRDFSISEKGASTPFLKASSAWLLIDTLNRRPARPHQALSEFPLRPEVAVGDSAPERISKESKCSFINSRNAYHSDLDPNGHVNNSRYFDWITDSLAQHLGQFPSIDRICINFHKEIQLGNEVKISIKSYDNLQFYIEGKTETHPQFSAKVKIRV